MTDSNVLTHKDQEIVDGLTAPVKYLPSKLFYDTQGLILYNEIMSLPEYYLVNSDLEILKACSKIIIQTMAKYNKDLFYIVDLGAGNALKTQILIQEALNQHLPFNYIPVDLDAVSLQILQQELTAKFPHLSITSKQGDYFEILQCLKNLDHPKLILFLGSSIGNYSFPETNDFLNKLQRSLNKEDKVLIGFDLVKDPVTILTAYNDSKGITKKFNFNLLTRLNNEFDADFDLQNFVHYPSYDPIKHAAHSHLISTKQQAVNLKKLNLSINFYAWEPIHTETSYKYHAEQITQFAISNRFQVLENFYDDKKYFVNSLWELAK